MIELRCPTEADTRVSARKLAATLRPGDVIILSGPLGAGKTLFVSGLASGLGIEETVVSPSFVLARLRRIRGAARREIRAIRLSNAH